MSWTKESLDKNSSFAFGLSSNANTPPAGWLQDDNDLKSLTLDGTHIVDVGMKGSKGPALALGDIVVNKSFREAYLACRVPASDSGADAPIGFTLSQDGASSWSSKEVISPKGVPSTPQGQPQTDKVVGMDIDTQNSILAIAFKRNAKHVLSIVYRNTSPKGDWQMSKVTVDGNDYYGAIKNPKDAQGNPVVKHSGIALGDDLVITNEAPALLSGNGWFLAFGEHGGHRVYLGQTRNSQPGSGWTFQALPEVKAAKHMGPGLTWFGAKVVVAWYDDDGKIFTSTYKPSLDKWDAPKPVKVGNDQITCDSGPLQLGYASIPGRATLYLSYQYNNKARLLSTTAL